MDVEIVEVLPLVAVRPVSVVSDFDTWLAADDEERRKFSRNQRLVAANKVLQ